MTENTQVTPASKYVSLSAIFFRGQFRGQLDSVYKDRESKPEKVDEYKTALEEKDAAPIPDEISHQQAQKLATLGIPLPETTSIVSPRKKQETEATQEATQEAT